MARDVPSQRELGEVGDPGTYRPCMVLLYGNVMVAPITTTSSTSYWAGYFPGWPAGRMGNRVSQTRRKQRRPYNLVLPYDVRAYQVVSPSMDGNIDAANLYGTYHDASKAFDVDTLEYLGYVEFARRTAREKFSGALSESASLAVSLAERKQAMTMIERRCLSLYRMVKALKRFDFNLAAHELALAGVDQPFREANRMRRSGRLRSGSHYFADNYLEFHFGWSPMVADIVSALDVLQQPIPFGPVSGRGRYSGNRKWLSEQNGQFGSCESNHAFEVFVKCGANVYVSNPNLWLANKLGLINPALVAMELVSYSFVADWFVNLSDFLGQFTEFAGLTVADQYTSVKTKDTSSWYRHIGNLQSPVADLGVNVERDFYRINTLPGVKLGLRKPWRLSPRRAFAACSLLVQQMRR
jgi:hypothetical protein